MQKFSCVLLVDDDQTTNYLNRLLLNRLGVAEKILVAHNGREAIDALSTHCQVGAGSDCPTLILLDVNMPVMNGFEFLEAYARLPAVQRQAMVVVMLTTSLHPQDIERARQLEVADFLAKPLTSKHMTEVLSKHLQRELPGREES